MRAGGAEGRGAGRANDEEDLDCKIINMGELK